MAVNIGRIKKIGIGVESTYGTKASTITWVPVLEPLTENPQQERVVDESAIGRIEKPLSNAIVRKWSEPSTSIIVNDDNIGILLRAVFGTVATSANDPEAGVNTHDFTVKNDNDPVSLTIVYKDANRTKMITGAVVNTANFQMVQNNYLKLDVSFMGKFPADTTDTPSFTEDNIFTGTMGTIKLASAISGLSGASAVCFQEANVEINKNASLEEFFCIGNAEPDKAANKAFELSGSFTRVMDDEVYADLFDAGTDQAISFSFVNTGVTIGAATNPTISFEIAPASLENHQVGSGLDDITTESWDFTGQYSQSDAKIGSAQLINTTASY